jgi:hypothetical protein
MSIFFSFLSFSLNLSGPVLILVISSSVNEFLSFFVFILYVSLSLSR